MGLDTKQGNHMQNLSNDTTIDTIVHVLDSSLSEFIHQYLRQYISLADQKAAFIFTISSAIVAYTTTSSFSPFKAPCICPITFHIACGYISILLFILSALASVAVVFPRLSQITQQHKGLIFWEEIRNFSSAEEYSAKFIKLTKQDTLKEISTHSYILAGICKNKYFALNGAMYLAAGAFIFWLLYLYPILSKLSSNVTGGV